MLPLLIRALATWRLAHLFMYEAGPGNVVQSLREYFGVRHDDDGPIAYPDGSVFECFLCFSVWVGFVVALVSPKVLQPFALSALAIWAERWYKNGSR